MLLRKQGVAAAAKKASRATGEGQVAAYVHTGGKIGVLVEVNCETDFAARSDDFQELIKALAMHVAAAAPRFLAREDVTQEVLAEEREIAREQAARLGKPEKVLDKIVEGKLEKFYAQNTLLEQGFVKDPDVSISDLLAAKGKELGDTLGIRRYELYQIGA
jgi:elongation factor Ts